MKPRRKKGQSTLEYMIIFLVIVAAIAAFAWTKLNPAIQQMMNKAGGVINNSSDTFSTNVSG